MSEEQAQKNLQRDSVREVAGGDDTVRTFLLECSRKNSVGYLSGREEIGGKPTTTGNNNTSSWTNRINGFKVERGDKISVEAI